jgi:hypothetical protein
MVNQKKRLCQVRICTPIGRDKWFARDLNGILTIFSGLFKLNFNGHWPIIFHMNEAGGTG